MLNDLDTLELREGKFDDDADRFRAAIEADPGQVLPRLNLVLALFRAGHLEKARATRLAEPDWVESHRRFQSWEQSRVRLERHPQDAESRARRAGPGTRSVGVPKPS